MKLTEIVALIVDATRSLGMWCSLHAIVPLNVLDVMASYRRLTSRADPVPLTPNRDCDSGQPNWSYPRYLVIVRVRVYAEGGSYFVADSQFD